MKRARQILLDGMLAAAIMAVAPFTRAEIQTTGTPGSPSATTTIDGKQIPPPPLPFGGVIKESATDSKPWWPPTVVPPKGAPNVLLIMTDDQGYGVSGTFGGVIPTPAMDRIAKAGLRYTQFHSTALCSPTRAALITGRNHHSVGFGVIGEMSTGFPGYDSVIGPESATIGEILKENGYATSWFGKNHNTPTYLYSVAGPFDQWPIGMGFQYFYGSWAVRPTSGRRTFTATRLRSFPGSARRITTSPPTGGRGNQVHEQPERGRPRPAVLCLLRAGRDPFAAPTDQGMDREIQRQVRYGLGKIARPDLRQSEEARCDPGDHPTDSLAGCSP
jgi:Arylsulfatase A and related enzymes